MSRRHVLHSWPPAHRMTPRHVRHPRGRRLRTPLVRPTARSLPSRYTAPLLASAALFVAAGGYVHLREWLDTYRHVPADAAGSFVVRIGFPINATASALLAVALACNAWRRTRFMPQVIVAAVTFQAVSLATLIATRTGTLFGWTEPSWTSGADQVRAVQIGALLTLTAVPAVIGMHRLATTRIP